MGKTHFAPHRYTVARSQQATPTRVIVKLGNQCIVGRQHASRGRVPPGSQRGVRTTILSHHGTLTTEDDRARRRIQTRTTARITGTVAGTIRGTIAVTRVPDADQCGHSPSDRGPRHIEHRASRSPNTRRRWRPRGGETPSETRGDASARNARAPAASTTRRTADHASTRVSEPDDDGAHGTCPWAPLVSPVLGQPLAAQPRKDSSARARETCRSRESAFSLICRTRSRVIPSKAPICSSVIGSSASSPK